MVLEAPNARIRWPELPPVGRMEMGWGQGGVEESRAFSLENVAVASPCSASPLSLGSSGDLPMAFASPSLQKVQNWSLPKLDMRLPQGWHAW